MRCFALGSQLLGGVCNRTGTIGMEMRPTYAKKSEHKDEYKQEETGEERDRAESQLRETGDSRSVDLPPFLSFINKYPNNLPDL